MSTALTLASIPLESVNVALQTCSLVVGICVGTVTLYRIFRHKDTREIIERLERIEGNCPKCGNAHDAAGYPLLDLQ